MKLLLVGDLHFRPKLGYADYVSDGREAEKQNVLDQIVEISKDHDAVVFMGDNLNSRTNDSKVIKDFVAFVERFMDGGKEVVILAGNHEKHADGRSAIDFMKEVKRPWRIISDKTEFFGLLGTIIVFHPYLYRQEVKAQDNAEASEVIKEILPDGDIFVGHQTISGFSCNGIPTEQLDEPILDADFLREKYKFSVVGHIHKSDYKDNILLTGSVFNNEINEIKKSVWSVSYENGQATTTEHPLKQRGIYKLVDPEEKDILAIEPSNIVKVEVTKRDTNVDALKKQLKRFDGSIVIERYPNERATVEIDGDLNDFSVENMLSLFAKSKGIEESILMKGFELIR